MTRLFFESVCETDGAMQTGRWHVVTYALGYGGLMRAGLLGVGRRCRRAQGSRRTGTRGPRPGRPGRRLRCGAQSPSGSCGCGRPGTGVRPWSCGTWIPTSLPSTRRHGGSLAAGVLGVGGGATDVRLVSDGSCQRRASADENRWVRGACKRRDAVQTPR
jgi:hypothetical protein